MKIKAMGTLLKKSKRHLLAAAALTCILLVICGLTIQKEGMSGAGAAYIAAAFAIGLFSLITEPKGKAAAVYQAAVIAVTPLLAVLLLQNYMINPFGLHGFSGYLQDAVGNKGMYPAMLAVNCLFAYLFYLLLSFILGSWRMGYTIATVLFMLAGIADYFVIQFRGTPIMPWDFLSLKTAASVAGNYTYEMNSRFLISTFCFVVLIIAAAKCISRIRPLPFRIVGVLLCTAGLLAAGIQLQKKEVKDWLGMDQTLFTPTVRYRNNGFLAAFIGNLHLIYVEKPEGYSAAEAEEIGSAFPVSSEQTYDLTEMPNIIVIMDEAFSDLAVLGEFGVTEDYMPNFRKLMDEYTGGYLMTSVKGGNTANTEYEFLSGDTMAFLPEGSVVYQQFIHGEVPTLATYLLNLGYQTEAIHPYLPGGWDRDTVYPLLGFETFLSQYDFENPDRVRDYISDKAAFEKIIEEFENKAEDDRTFIFEVTMQNHSGYSKEYAGFTEEVLLTDLSYSNTQTKAVEKYLTLIKYSDDAVGELIDYFETVDEPTIIVMFGDHEPTDYITDVIARITGYDGEASLEERQKAYQVPYFVWNNMGLDIDVPELTSVNYLAADILSAAGFPLTSYQQFLLNMQESLPVICANACVDTDNSYYAYDEESEYQELLQDYQILAYNHLTDEEHRVESLFSLPLIGGSDQ